MTKSGLPDVFEFYAFNFASYVYNRPPAAASKLVSDETPL